MFGGLFFLLYLCTRKRKDCSDLTQNGALAQLVEHRTENPCVPLSSFHYETAVFEISQAAVFHLSTMSRGCIHNIKWQQTTLLFHLITQCSTNGCTELSIFGNMEAHLIKLLQHGIDILTLGQQRQVTYQDKVLDTTIEC